ncbi:MAG: hypothetical protein JNM10_04450, partial [Planctomycetia bacterium]|nr:hypothetical protein [Planctomycetia bacterium]
MRVRLPLLLALATLVAHPRAASPGEGAARRAAPPAENVSYVPSDDPVQRKAFAAADEAAAAGDALKAART